MKRPAARWLFAGAAILAAVTLLAVTPQGSAARGFAVVVLVLWLAASLGWLAWRVWRFLTYRVAVRLFISYLLIGVTPILSLLACGGFALYVLAGQYTSVRYGDTLIEAMTRLEASCVDVAAVASLEGGDAGLKRLYVLTERSSSYLKPLVQWTVHGGTVSYRPSGPGPQPPLPAWVDGVRSEIVRFEHTHYAMTACRDGDAVVVALIPLDQATARAISEASWFDIAFTAEGTGGADGSQSFHVSTTAAGDNLVLNVGDSTTADQLWPSWRSDDDGLLDKPWVLWFRIANQVLDLATGEPVTDGALVSLLRTSVHNAWDDFVLSRYELASGLRGIAFGVAGFFLVLYALALAVAIAMIWSITRSTARLSRGARAVAGGDLDHRIKVRRHDQLGDLADRFNQMTASVQGMLADVAEKERLAHELELAREIQESLLPARSVQYGPVTVAAAFQPATEVGGDYFDVFPVDERRVVVTIGDVAGHGLPTGLLMASLKSAVAALVYEGYDGPELLRRLNRVLIDQRPGRTMVTLAMLEIDPIGHHLRVTSAGHPPLFLVAPDGGVHELSAGSLPLGCRLFEPRTSEHELAPGCRIVLYSDGVVEAIAADGEPVGYERFATMLRGHRDTPAAELTAAVLRAWRGLVGDDPPADDVTLLTIEIGSAEQPQEAE